jgi:2-dehydro-3-deoxyphosphogluconate aldolase/(4S)-4-hydroxy-2-oxoglutarate aldolase
MTPIERIMRTAPVIPVLVIDDAHQARAIAQALVSGGLRVIEVTLRTAAGIDAIRRMNLVPDAIVGAGTVVNEAQFEEARAAGAEFVVSPGLTRGLAAEAARTGMPFLPGVATASDIMRGLDLGLTHFKFFPAEAAGGIPALKALSAPFAQCRFCPTGGITADNAPEWLALPQVLCVGGSWIVPKGADPSQVHALAQEAAALARH